MQIKNICKSVLLCMLGIETSSCMLKQKIECKRCRDSIIEKQDLDLKDKKRHGFVHPSFCIYFLFFSLISLVLAFCIVLVWLKLYKNQIYITNNLKLTDCINIFTKKIYPYEQLNETHIKCNEFDNSVSPICQIWIDSQKIEPIDGQSSPKMLSSNIISIFQALRTPNASLSDSQYHDIASNILFENIQNSDKFISWLVRAIKEDQKLRRMLEKPYEH